MNNGPRKGAEPRTIALLLKELGDTGVFQLHRNVREGAVNAEPARVANAAEESRGEMLRLRVDRRGDHYAVEIPSRGAVRDYNSR